LNVVISPKTGVSCHTSERVSITLGMCKRAAAMVLNFSCNFDLQRAVFNCQGVQFARTVFLMLMYNTSCKLKVLLGSAAAQTIEDSMAAPQPDRHDQLTKRTGLFTSSGRVPRQAAAGQLPNRQGRQPRRARGPRPVSYRTSSKASRRRHGKAIALRPRNAVERLAGVRCRFPEHLTIE